MLKLRLKIGKQEKGLL